MPFRDLAWDPQDPAVPALALDDAQKTRLAELKDPMLLRRLQQETAGRRAAALAPGSSAPQKDLPWSADRLLANPTNMNDEHLALAENPATGSLFAVFAATDLGGTDRDIHIAHSTDGGASWTVREMPSSSLDEYHPDIAIDGAGYLHVVWVRADGSLMRARSSAPDNADAWTHVFQFLVGEPLAIPSLAVSGSGDFAKVFIAVDWQTINYDYMAYEWTILFLHSTNGGLSLNYDYFLPDGYEDLWPVVAMNGGTVHLVNAEVDLETGQTEILIATDNYSGGFATPGLLTGWTENNCGFPDIACQGDDVFLVYQHDFTDGLTTDGDIIYNYSWDAGTSFFGPIGMAADEYESVGPSVFTRNGVVGCLWLDAPAGGDEFQLAARLGSGYGHTDFMGNVEIVSDRATVEPMYRSCAGLASTTGQLQAVWIDRRDYPTQGLNVYTSERDLTANLAPYAPDGWGDSLVASMIRGERSDGILAADRAAYVSFALLNDGLVDVTDEFQVHLLRDGSPIGAWNVSGLPTGTYLSVEDYEITVPAGIHTLTVSIDAGDAIAEDDETDNQRTRTLSWITGDARLRLNPGQLVETILPDAPKSAAIQLISHPPLRDERTDWRIGTELAQAMDVAAKSQRLHVIIVPAQRLDPVAARAALQGAAPTTRRSALLAAARAQNDNSWQLLRDDLQRVAARGDAGEARPQWISGTIATTMTVAGIEEFARHPDVGRLWLDQTVSEPFAQPRLAGPTTSGEQSDTFVDKAIAWHLPLIGADAAWARGADGSGILVGHLDTGIAYDHPDLAGRMWDGGAAWPSHGFDAVDEDNDPYDGDSWFHGTHTAGLIAGDGSGGTSTGAAPGATLMALRSVPGYVADMNEALQFGLDHGVDLFSYSGGWTNPSEELRAQNRFTAEMLLAADVPWICAAGNGDNRGGHIGAPHDIASPGDCPSAAWAPAGGETAVLAVGGLNSDATVWEGSSYGPTEWAQTSPYQGTTYSDYPGPAGLNKPDIAAPAANVTSCSGNNGYVAYDGTSMACPLVAGSAAILLGEAPWLTVEQLYETLSSTASDVTTAPAAFGRDNFSGAGLVNINAALNHVPTARASNVWICNDGELPLILSQVLPAAPWLAVEPPVAAIAPGDSLRCDVLIDPSGLLEGFHQSQILFVSNDPQVVHTLPVTLVYGEDLTPVDEGPAPAAVPQLTNRPNPFNPRTILHFETSGPGEVRIDIFDLKGRRVRKLLHENLPTGVHQATWDGLDSQGRAVSSGQYLARLEAAGFPAVTRKMLLLR